MAGGFQPLLSDPGMMLGKYVWSFYNRSQVPQCSHFQRCRNEMLLTPGRTRAISCPSLVWVSSVVT